MKSFRTEIEDPIVEKDILDLEKKIRAFQGGEMDEEKFRSLRLARGVYGQRQSGVQMIRIKLPYGKMTARKLERIASVSDEYSTGNLHITTRQDIQIHYVSLDRTPELWAELEKDQVTLREACGNTVRNVTGSPYAGIDKNEPFDITPYAHEVFEYFLRNPICQDMGRKFKISFSSSDADDSYSFMHDVGFIPKIKEIDGKQVRGFKVMICGGLGSQPFLAQEAYEFLSTDQIIPFVEGVLRVFDRHGERSRRNKARSKFLMNDIGLESFMELVEGETKALKNKTYPIVAKETETIIPTYELPSVQIQDVEAYEKWKATNVIEQKQEGFFSIGLKIINGDFSSDSARRIAELVKEYTADDMRLTIHQGLIIRHIKEELLPFFYTELQKIGMVTPGFESIHDITACPGTDTCNLGIASSMGAAKKLDQVLREEYQDLVGENKINIKISGCMNACGQHNAANIGFQGMTVRTKDKKVAPALQVLLGGGALGNGGGRFADKVTKIPSKRAPEALRLILEEYKEKANEGEYFNDFYDRMTEDYFFQLLKPLADIENLQDSDFIDWGNDEKYEKAIGVGECASVIIDLVQTLIFEAEERVENSKYSLEQNLYADSIYHSYTSFIQAAKALLTSTKSKLNTQASIIKAFNSEFDAESKLPSAKSFQTLVYQIRENEPTKQFAESYLKDAISFIEEVSKYRSEELQSTNE